MLIIDEAQNLSEESLEEIRMLSNLQKDGKLLLQIMLIGQPELKALLKHPNLTKISQKISVSYHLTALSSFETREYITYRLKKAGCDLELFSREAKDLIYEKSAGIPRIINLVCDSALIYGFAEKLQSIDKRAVENTIKEIDRPGTNFSSEYADSILSAPIIKDENKNDLLNRIKTIEEDLSKLQKQFELSSKEFENSLNYLTDALIKKIKKIVIYERKRTGQLIKQYFQKIYKRSTPDKAHLEKKDRKVASIKRKKDYEI